MTSRPRFQLPALNLNFGSITDGTDIPPPPDSPIQKVPTPPHTPPLDKDRDEKAPREEIKQAASQDSKPAPINGNHTGTKRTADEAPLSPAASSRQGSLRRLLSRTMLNNSYAEGQSSPSTGSPSTVQNGNGRPISQSGGSSVDDKKAKRASGWFRRLRSGGEDQSQSKRSTMLFDDHSMPASPGHAPAPAPVQRKFSGPPPPMIPELSSFNQDSGSLGDDLFKNIK